jgi:hypothetical protein
MRAIDFVSFPADNAHGAAFERSAVRDKLHHDPAYAAWSRHRKIKKEITEAYGALRAVRGVVGRSRVPQTRGEACAGDDCDGEDLVFLELCSGRGFVSIVFADAYPKARVYMLDIDSKMDVSHLEALERVTFHLQDLHSNECEAFIRSVCREAGHDKTVILVGVHLCGALAPRAIELYESVAEIAALVLSPCCLPQRRRHDVFGYHCVDIARAIKSVTAYQCWCTQLFFHVPVSSRRNMIIDHDMLSQQNAFITALKPPLDFFKALTVASPSVQTIIPGRVCAKWKILPSSTKGDSHSESKSAS